MSFSDHKITAFTHRIADLPDQPNMPADELKARFDSSPEELRQSVNGICDDADRLEERVEGIIAETFGDTIDKSMLSTELAAELDTKAVETSVASRINSEKSARTSSDNALSNRISSLETAVPQKARVVYGTYTGNGTENRLITVGFRPRFVLVSTTTGDTYNRHFGVFADFGTMWEAAGSELWMHPAHLETNGFRVSKSESGRLDDYSFNEDDIGYGYVAIGT